MPKLLTTEETEQMYEEALQRENDPLRIRYKQLLEEIAALYQVNKDLESVKEKFNDNIDKTDDVEKAIEYKFNKDEILKLKELNVYHQENISRIIEPKSINFLVVGEYILEHNGNDFIVKTKI